MKFLNKKEQVMDIELTSYGRHLLSLGKMKPVYYAFFDDDVIYDSEYSGFKEVQNNTQQRIKETVKLETQYSWVSAETTVLQNNRFIRMGEIDPETGRYKRLSAKQVQPTPDKHYSLSAPIGTMSIDTDHAPAWSINVLNGEISSSANYKQGNHPTLKIPQLVMSPVVYKISTFIDDSLLEESNPESILEDNLTSSPGNIGSLVSNFSDGSVVRVKEDFILLEVEENNTFYESENFHIEVYEVTEVDNEEILIPLFFRNEKEQVKNGILLDDEDLIPEMLELDPSYVEYFFNIFVDKEIDQNILCNAVPDNSARGVFSQRDLDCAGSFESNPIKLYDTDALEEDEC